MKDYPHVFQCPFSVLQAEGFAMKGRWNELFFRNNHPIVLELGCGRGEYTIGLARRYPERNFIGVDIKGARIWAGAKQAMDEQLPNVAFLRTHIELICSFFAPGEASEIWITFPDPQMKKTNKRMTSARFMGMYRKILCDSGLIHLKTDSNFLFAYTREMIRVNRLPVLVECQDLALNGPEEADAFSIQTFYERQWRARGMAIKYICFVCEPRDFYAEPEAAFVPDAYRSFNRSRRSMAAAKFAEGDDNS